jgi:RNA polymerase sigma factor (sigma-70 family)
MISKPINLDYLEASGIAEAEHLRVARFTDWFAEHRPALLAFIVTRTGGDANAAGDCLQEVALVLWKKHEPRWSSEDFRRYAFRCAEIEARSFRRRNRRLGRRIVYLAPDIVQALGTEAQQLIAEDPFSNRQRLDALRLCLDQLESTQRELLDARYERTGLGKTVSEIAKERGCKIETLYKRLERIRTSLQACILKRLKELPP